MRKNDHYGALEILIDTDPGFKPDLYETVRLLGLEAERWYPSASSMGFCGDGRTDAEFLTWVENHIRSKNPVITGVFVGGEDASVTEYEHIVPIRGIDRSKGTLSINTNYSATPIDISTTPVRIGSGCPDSKAYCLASNRGTKEAPISPPTSWGVAVQPPSGQKLPVRIQVTGCSGGVCKLNGKAIPSEQNGIASKGWMEPNWTLRGIEPVSYELEATIENPNGQAQSGLRIARVDARTPEEIRALQAEGGPFGANAHSCYPAMASEGISVGAAETKKSVKQIDPVQSDRAAFFRVVTAQEATTVCPGINPLPEPTLRVAQCTGIPRSSCETPAAGAAERLELQSQAVDGK
ncbi:MAG: hypothetical protein VYB51_06095, partial [Gemmatimonadota bacterium]|nr:hypothetical protein [Gemmatimonadota bacterium]